MPLTFSTDQLIDLYRIAIEEYRFEVKLNWDRTAYYLTVNGGIVPVAIGLLKIGDQPIYNLFVAGVFLFGFFAAWTGFRAIKMGHEYYRRTIMKKTLIEDVLGLTVPLKGYPLRHTLAVDTTGGQAAHLRILHTSDEWMNRGVQRNSITFLILFVLVLFGVLDLVGALGSAWLYFHSATTLREGAKYLLVL